MNKLVIRKMSVAITLDRAPILSWTHCFQVGFCETNHEHAKRRINSIHHWLDSFTWLNLFLGYATLQQRSWWTPAVFALKKTWDLSISVFLYLRTHSLLPRLFLGEATKNPYYEKLLYRGRLETCMICSTLKASSSHHLREATTMSYEWAVFCIWSKHSCANSSCAQHQTKEVEMKLSV